MERKLHEASLTGNVQALNALLQEDQLILDRIQLNNNFNETPLHIAALHGHLDFTRLLLDHIPELAASLDFQRRSPLHLACSAGQVEVVKVLLEIEGGLDMCNICDQDGRTSLYLAAMNEHLEVIKVICQARSEIGLENEDQICSTLHMCVRDNCFEALKVLIELWSDEEIGELVDFDGNTLLHLSAMHKQTQITKFLLNRPSILANKNAVNAHGFTALDILDHNTRDIKTLETRELLIEVGISRAKNLNPLPNPQESTQTKTTREISTSQHEEKGFVSKLSGSFSKNKRSHFLEKERGNLVIAATIFAAMTYQAGISPPGGKFVYSNTSPSNGISMDDFSQILALVVSLTCIVILVSGFNLKNKFISWLLLQGMLTVFVFVTITYVGGIADMSPDTWVNEATFISCIVWISICGSYGFISTIYFAFRAIRKRVAKRALKTRNEDPIHA